MDKKEFLEKLSEKKKAIIILPKEYEEDIDQLKERIVPIVQQDFISSFPKKIREGEEIKIASRRFYIKCTGEKCYIKVDGAKIRIKAKNVTKDNIGDCQSLRELRRKIGEELSDLLEEKIEDVSWVASIGESYLQFRMVLLI